MDPVKLIGWFVSKYNELKTDDIQFCFRLGAQYLGARNIIEESAIKLNNLLASFQSHVNACYREVCDYCVKAFGIQ